MAENNQTDELEKKTMREHTRETASDHIAFYANNVQLEGTFWDLKLAFGEIVKADLTSLVTKDKVTVTITQELAKRLAEVLADHVEKYEQKFGTIPKAPA
jgi:hypothetical protein